MLCIIFSYQKYIMSACQLNTKEKEGRKGIGLKANLVNKGKFTFNK